LFYFRPNPKALFAGIQMKKILSVFLVTQLLALVAKGQQTLVIDNEVSAVFAGKIIN
jgi:hypothetical protein